MKLSVLIIITMTICLAAGYDIPDGDGGSWNCHAATSPACKYEPPHTRTPSSNFTPVITDPECLLNGVCEHFTNYPENRVAEILKALEGTKYRFNTERLYTPDIFQKPGSDLETLNLCKSYERIIAPRAVRDTNYQWYTVLNQKNKPQQSYRIEVCDFSPENAPCSELVYVTGVNYNKICVQKHEYRVISVLNSEGELIEKDFPLPSCCSCAVEVLNTLNATSG